MHEKYRFLHQMGGQNTLQLHFANSVASFVAKDDASIIFGSPILKI